MMNINSTIPVIIFWLNVIILAINVYNIIRLMVQLKKNEANRPYLLILLLSATALIMVNTFSAINHYIVYFSELATVPAAATWLRFSDRYSMLFKVMFNTLMSSPYCLMWMKKFYILKKD